MGRRLRLHAKKRRIRIAPGQRKTLALARMSDHLWPENRTEWRSTILD